MNNCSLQGLFLGTHFLHTNKGQSSSMQLQRKNVFKKIAMAALLYVLDITKESVALAVLAVYQRQLTMQLYSYVGYSCMVQV
jgi:hypothetical protein